MVKWVALVAVVGWLAFLVVSLHDFVFEPIYERDDALARTIGMLHPNVQQGTKPPGARRGADLPAPPSR